MSKMAHTIDDSGLPDWFTYPSKFVRLVEQGLVD